jgi:NAD(P)-dependent dehydrogenase (short-subunit alcohol dehydrogenase family)
MDRFNGKVALCAGSATGMGAQTAVQLAREGAQVVVGDVNEAGAQALVDRITAEGGQALAVKFDIAEESSVAALFAATVERFGGLDLMHVNAADLRIVRKDFDACAIDLEVFDRSLAVDLRGHLLCTRFAIPEMKKRGGGAIVYTSSDAAHGAATSRVGYYVAKAGCNALMRHVAIRWGPENIRSNAVCPGVVLTEAVQRNMPEAEIAAMRAHTPSTRLGKPEDIAATVCFLLSDEAEWINGQAISVNGGALMKS